MDGTKGFGLVKKKIGRPKKKLVDQKMWNWPDNWSTKETDQKYMDAALVDNF